MGMLKKLDKYLSFMLVCNSNLGSRYCSSIMKRYIKSRRKDGIYLFNLKKLLKKFLIIISTLICIQNPKSILIIGTHPIAKSPVKYFCRLFGFKAIINKYISGTFSNIKLASFLNYRFALLTDSSFDTRAL